MLGLHLLERVWLMDKRFGCFCLALVLSSAFPAAHAQDAVDPLPTTMSASADVRDMDAVVVTGVQPGPGLWRARRADGHTLYILGAQSPLPADITWRADEVREVLAEAGVVLGQPGARLSADVGFLRGLTLAPSALRAMRNPDGATLDELLPSDLYARWTTLKARYIGRDRGIERKRPFIAVAELYRAALKQHGLRDGGVIAPVIDEVLKARGMKITPTLVQLKVDDPRAALASFRRETLKQEELDCVRGTFGIIEHDLPEIAARANAWAVGDLDALRAMPDTRSQIMSCLSAVNASETARNLGMADIEPKVDDAWLAAVDTAIAEHRTVFATLSINTLLRSGGLLERLRARGYTVLAPDEPDLVEDDEAQATAGP